MSWGGVGVGWVGVGNVHVPLQAKAVHADHTLGSGGVWNEALLLLMICWGGVRVGVGSRWGAPLHSQALRPDHGWGGIGVE